MLVLVRRWWIENDFEILRRTRSDVLDLMLVAGSDESGRAGPELGRFIANGDFHLALADQKHFFLLVMMGVMRGASRQQKDFMNMKVNSTMR